jgi:hypothetical protein
MRRGVPAERLQGTNHAMSTQEKEKVIKAIGDLGRRVTVADVATKTGLPLLVVSSELNKVASETGGHLQVATTGDIAYKFALGFQTAYLTHGIRKVFEEISSKIMHAAFFLIRISFGVALITSLLIIIVAIILLTIWLNQMNNRDDDNGNLDIIDFIVWRDIIYGLIWWNNDPYRAYGGSGHDMSRPYKLEIGQKSGKTNFLFTCFSFLFGDGNPNQDLDERQWQLIAQAIKSHGGAITVEQLAPYTGSDPNNEDSVLPVLVRFDGKPEVTETGNIIYLFPSLQSTASASDKSHVPSHLQERTIAFSQATNEELIPVIGLGVANCLGSWWLLSLVRVFPSPYLEAHWLPLAIALVLYGTGFLIIPSIRWLVVLMINKRIEKRNARRESFSLPLRNPEQNLQTKLNEAAALSQKNRLVDQKNIVYSTDEDALDQEFEKPVGS